MLTDNDRELLRQLADACDHSWTNHPYMTARLVRLLRWLADRQPVAILTFMPNMGAQINLGPGVRALTLEPGMAFEMYRPITEEELTSELQSIPVRMGADAVPENGEEIGSGVAAGDEHPPN